MHWMFNKVGRLWGKGCPKDKKIREKLRVERKWVKETTAEGRKEERGEDELRICGVSCISSKV